MDKLFSKKDGNNKVVHEPKQAKCSTQFTDAERKKKEERIRK